MNQGSHRETAGQTPTRRIVASARDRKKLRAGEEIYTQHAEEFYQIDNHQLRLSSMLLKIGQRVSKRLMAI